MLDWKVLFENREGAQEQFEELERRIPGIMEFSPKDEYAYGNIEHKRISSTTHRIETGRSVNLIYCMIERGATTEELGRALRHLMVCLDAMKHDLNWKKSKNDAGITELEKKYRKGEMKDDRN